MKKLLSAALAFLLLSAAAFALTANVYPRYDGVIAENQIGGMFDTEPLLLSFDVSADYSMCDNGYLQACFYATDGTENSYVELFLLFPQTAKSGDVISPAYAAETGMSECGVYFYEVKGSSEDAYIAAQTGGDATPEGSNYEIRIESFEETDSAYNVRGSVNAVLVKTVEFKPTGELLTVQDAAFHFSMPKSAAPQETPAPDSPQQSAEPQETPAPDFPRQSAAPEPTDDPFAFFESNPPKTAPTLAPFFGGMPKSTEPAALFTLPPDFARI